MQDKQYHKYEKCKAIESKHKRICFEVRVIVLRPRLHHYDWFHYSLRDHPQRDLTPKGLQLGLLKTGVHNSTNSILYTRDSSKTKRVYKALGDLARPQILPHNFLKSGIWGDAQEAKWEKNIS